MTWSQSSLQNKVANYELFAFSNQNIDAIPIKKYRIYINAAGPTVVTSVSLDVHISSPLSVELGVGIWGYFAGMKYYFIDDSPQKWIPYVGGYVTHLPPLELDSEDDANTGVYIPVGLQYLTNRSFTFAAELAIMKLNNENRIPLLYGSLKFGFQL